MSDTSMSDGKSSDDEYQNDEDHPGVSLKGRKEVEGRGAATRTSSAGGEDDLMSGSQKTHAKKRSSLRD